MTLTVWGVLFIIFIFGGSLYCSLHGIYTNRQVLVFSITFGLLFVAPVGDGVEKWGEQNRAYLEVELKRIPIQKKSEKQFSELITEQDGVYLYLYGDDGKLSYFIPKENIREVESIQSEESYLAIYHRFDPKRSSFLVPFVKNDEYFVFYKGRTQRNS